MRFPAYEAENPAVDSYLYVKDSALRKTYDEFMTGKGSTNPRRARRRRPSVDATPTPQPKRKRNKASSIQGLEVAETEGENQAGSAGATKIDFPSTTRAAGDRRPLHQSGPRIYAIRDGQASATPTASWPTPASPASTTASRG